MSQGGGSLSSCSNLACRARAAGVPPLPVPLLPARISEVAAFSDTVPRLLPPLMTPGVAAPLGACEGLPLGGPFAKGLNGCKHARWVQQPGRRILRTSHREQEGRASHLTTSHAAHGGSRGRRHPTPAWCLCLTVCSELAEIGPEEDGMLPIPSSASSPSLSCLSFSALPSSARRCRRRRTSHAATAVRTAARAGAGAGADSSLGSCSSPAAMPLPLKYLPIYPRAVLTIYSRAAPATDPTTAPTTVPVSAPLELEVPGQDGNDVITSRPVLPLEVTSLGDAGICVQWYEPRVCWLGSGGAARQPAIALPGPPGLTPAAMHPAASSCPPFHRGPHCLVESPAVPLGRRARTAQGLYEQRGRWREDAFTRAARACTCTKLPPQQVDAHL